MTAFRFRLLLSLYVILSVAALAASWYSSDLIPPAIRAAVDAEPVVWDVANLPLTLSIILPLGIGSVAGLIGMYMFKPWARTFSLVFTVAGLIVVPFMGTVVLSQVDYIMVELAAMVWGAVLALAYYSPVSSLFSGTKDGHA